MITIHDGLALDVQTTGGTITAIGITVDQGPPGRRHRAWADEIARSLFVRPESERTETTLLDLIEADPAPPFTIEARARRGAWLLAQTPDPELLPPEEQYDD